MKKNNLNELQKFNKDFGWLTFESGLMNFLKYNAKVENSFRNFRSFFEL
jgi:hypothetical protein